MPSAALRHGVLSDDAGVLSDDVGVLSNDAGILYAPTPIRAFLCWIQAVFPVFVLDLDSSFMDLGRSCLCWIFVI
jgi:hypothetical protein